jgi:hypothetical protein
VHHRRHDQRHQRQRQSDDRDHVPPADRRQPGFRDRRGRRDRGGGPERLDREDGGPANELVGVRVFRTRDRPLGGDDVLGDARQSADPQVGQWIVVGPVGFERDEGGAQPG